MEQQIIEAYQQAFGRAPGQEAIDFYSNVMQQNPDFNLMGELQASPEFQARQAYQDILGRQPGMEAIRNFINSGTTAEQLRDQLQASPEFRENARQNPRSLRQVTENLPIEIPEGEGVVPLAYTLATGTELNLPEYQVAGFTPDQQAAFQRARDLQGAYIPFSQAGYESTMQGIGAMGDALSGTLALAGQIPGEVRPGQEALGRAAEASYDVAGRGRGQAAMGQEGANIAAARARADAATGQTGADIAAARARMSTADAQRALQEASGFGLGSAQQGIAGLRGSEGMYSPDMIAPFMSDYEDAAVQQALADLARQGELQEQQLEAQAVQAGAYGGSRQAVAEQELARNIMEQQGRTAAQMRAQGYESAAQRSQEAFERAMARQQQAAQLTGQLGQIGAGAAAGAAEAGGRLGLEAERLAQGSALQGAQLGLSAEQLAQGSALQGAGLGLSAEQLAGQMAGQAGNLGLQSSQLGLQGIQVGLGAQQQAAGIGTGIAQLGQQQLGFGQAAQQLGQQDVSTRLQIGQQLQAQQQAELDAQRMNEYQQAMMPYQQLAFLSDITTGAPTGITSVMSQPVQSPSAISQLGGLALGAGALFGQGGLFGRPT